jgi:hypothetical protein
VADQWTFPAGTVDSTDSLKGYRVDGSDGHIGKVAWCDYAPGDSYLIVDVGVMRRHHLVPAGAVAGVDHDSRTVTLKVTADEVRSTPIHEDPETAYTEAKLSYLDRFEIGALEGRGIAWPYSDD